MGRSACILRSCVAVLLFVSCTSSETVESGAPQGTLLIADTLFDGTRFFENRAVLIQDGVVASVGSSEALLPEAGEVVDLGDATLLPGFIDLHVHTAAVGTYKELVDEGVTTVRDLGISEDLLPFPESSPLKVVVAGPLITAPGGYPIPIHGERVGGPVAGTAEARAKVRDLAAKGAGVIKVAIHLGRARWPILSLSELRAIVDEAHKWDLPVTAHVQERFGVDLALAAGVDEFAHMPCTGALGNELWQKVVAADIEIVGTLHVLDDYCRGAGVRAARRFIRAGGELLYGTDLGSSSIPFGIDIRELELMMDAGLSLEETLAGATARAGEQLGMAPLGSLGPGAPADLIAVNDDLRVDLPALESPLLIVVAGDVVRDNRS